MNEKNSNKKNTETKSLQEKKTQNPTYPFFHTVVNSRAAFLRRSSWLNTKKIVWTPKTEVRNPFVGAIANAPIASENSHQTWPHFSVFSCVCAPSQQLWIMKQKKTATKQQQFMRRTTTIFFIMFGSTENVGEWDETEIQFDHGLTSVQCAVFLCCCHSTVSFTTRFQLHITCMHFPLSRVSVRC